MPLLCIFTTLTKTIDTVGYLVVFLVTRSMNMIAGTFKISYSQIVLFQNTCVDSRRRSCG